MNNRREELIELCQREPEKAAALVLELEAHLDKNSQNNHKPPASAGSKKKVARNQEPTRLAALPLAGLIFIPALYLSQSIPHWEPVVAVFGLGVLFLLHYDATGHCTGHRLVDGTLFLLVLILMVGSWTTPDLDTSLPHIYVLMANLAIFWAAAAQRNTLWLRSTGWLLLLVGLFLALIFLLGTNFSRAKLFFIDQEMYAYLPGGWRSRLNPDGFNANVTGGLIALFLAPTVLLAWRGEGRLQQNVAGGIAVVLFLLLLLTQSRGALLAVFVALLMVAALISSQRWLRLVSSAGAVLGLLVILGFPGIALSQEANPEFRFENVAPQLNIGGILGPAYIHTASWGDVDNDGRLDLFAGTFVEGAATTPNKLLLNKGKTFEDARQAPIEINGRAAGSVLADLDNDGDLDLYVSNNRMSHLEGVPAEPSHLLRNDEGRFVDVSADSGIAAQAGNGRQVGILDYNNDGRLDLLIVADQLRKSGPTVLLKNLGDFKFENASEAANIPAGIKGLGLAIGDVSGNGWPDIFIAGGGAHDQNYLLLAAGDGTYRPYRHNQVFDWQPYVNGNEDWVSAGAFGDLNRDGWLDLVVGHHFGSSAEQGTGAALRIYMNRGLAGGDPRFEDITDRAGLPNIVEKAPHVEIQDFNNDGWPDIYTSVRVDTAEGLMPLIFTHTGLTAGEPGFSVKPYTNPTYYPGGPVADFDGDGRLDVFLSEFRTVLGEGTIPSLLLQNRGATGNWLQVKVDHPSNRMGVGARVKLYRPGLGQQPEGLLGLVEISPAFGFSSSQAAIAHFGLGAEELVDVVVELPFNGPRLTKANVPANQLLVMPEVSKNLAETATGQQVAAGDASLQDRQLLWSMAFQLMQDHPLTGVGLGMVEAATVQIDTDYTNAHNVYLQIGAELGLPGLMVFLLLFLSLAYLLIKRGLDRNAGPYQVLALGLLGSLIVFLVHGFFEIITRNSLVAIVVWALFGLMVAVSTTVLQHEQS